MRIGEHAFYTGYSEVIKRLTQVFEDRFMQVFYSLVRVLAKLIQMIKEKAAF
jgi:hypothetical protein